MIKDHNWHEMILCMIRWLSMAWGAFLPHLNLWTTHPLSSGLPLFLIPELRAVSGNLRQPEVKCFAYK